MPAGRPLELFADDRLALKPHFNLTLGARPVMARLDCFGNQPSKTVAERNLPFLICSLGGEMRFIGSLV